MLILWIEIYGMYKSNITIQHSSSQITPPSMHNPFVFILCVIYYFVCDMCNRVESNMKIRHSSSSLNYCPSLIIIGAIAKLLWSYCQAIVKLLLSYSQANVQSQNVPCFDQISSRNTSSPTQNTDLESNPSPIRSPIQSPIGFNRVIVYNKCVVDDTTHCI